MSYDFKAEDKPVPQEEPKKEKKENKWIKWLKDFIQTKKFVKATVTGSTLLVTLILIALLISMSAGPGAVGLFGIGVAAGVFAEAMFLLMMEKT